MLDDTVDHNFETKPENFKLRLKRPQSNPDSRSRSFIPETLPEPTTKIIKGARLSETKKLMQNKLFQKGTPWRIRNAQEESKKRAEAEA